MPNLLLLFLMLLIAAPGLMADVLVMKNGKRIEIDGTYEVKGRFIVFNNKDGSLIQLPLSVVDLGKSKQATAELIAKREAVAEAPKEIEVKKVNSMADIVDLVEGKRAKKRSGSGVSISDGRLKGYNEGGERVLTQQSAAAGGDTGSGNSRKAPRTDASVEQLSDPNYMAQQRKEAKENFDKANNELSKLDKQIKEAEYMRDVNASSAAFGSPNYAGEDSAGNPLYDEVADTSPFHDQMDKAEEHLADLQKRRAEKASEIKGLEGSARKNNVRNYNRSGQQNADSNKSRYGEDGKRKRLQGDSYKTKKKERDSNKNRDEKYDENGKRKRINQ